MNPLVSQFKDTGDNSVGGAINPNFLSPNIAPTPFSQSFVPTDKGAKDFGAYGGAGVSKDVKDVNYTAAPTGQNYYNGSSGAPAVANQPYYNGSSASPKVVKAAASPKKAATSSKKVATPVKYATADTARAAETSSKKVATPIVINPNPLFNGVLSASNKGTAAVDKNKGMMNGDKFSATGMQTMLNKYNSGLKGRRPLK